MNYDDLYKRTGKLRSSTQMKLNDIYIWCSLATQTLDRSLKDGKIIEQGRFNVPSSRTGKTVPRDPEKVKAIISNAAEKDLLLAVFVYIVAHGEAFISDIISIVLQFDPRLLLINVQGVDQIRNLEVKDLILESDIDSLVSRVIQKQLISLLYAKPAAQFRYLERVLGIEIDESLQMKWIEIKATRDLIVHNSSVINQIYIDKVGVAARGDIGGEVIVDSDYFEESIASTKTLAGRIANQIQKDAKSKMT